MWLYQSLDVFLIFSESEVFILGFYDDDEQPKSQTPLYQLRVEKGWFRGKDVFTDRLYMYERQLVYSDFVEMHINAGNMIYVMMRRLDSVDFEKQDALIASYRDLMYKLSYVNVVWYRNDRSYLHIEGEKSDIMWALAFITQVFPDSPLSCENITVMDAEHSAVNFEVQDGAYTGANMRQAQIENDVLPNIWEVDVVKKPETHENYLGAGVDYSYEYVPNSGEMFAISDGRVAEYIRMDERYIMAENYGVNMDPVMRHNISASCIKDFEDMVHTQTSMDYDLYRMRYVAFMNKVHELEKIMGGFEVSCYDILPIGERGLPYASAQTLERTNNLDCGSLKYQLDKIKRNKTHLSTSERKDLVRDIGHSILYRVDGYDIEYQTYMISGSSPELCANIRMQIICELYADFAEIDSYGLLNFPESVYRALCNDPENASYQMTPFEKQRLQVFGRGYLDFLQYQMQNVRSRKMQKIYESALKRLEQRYLK